MLINVAAHRRKTGWIRNQPKLRMLLMNPRNPYHATFGKP